MLRLHRASRRPAYPMRCGSACISRRIESLPAWPENVASASKRHRSVAREGQNGRGAALGSAGRAQRQPGDPRTPLRGPLERAGSIRGASLMPAPGVCATRASAAR